MGKEGKGERGKGGKEWVIKVKKLSLLHLLLINYSEKLVLVSIFPRLYENQKIKKREAFKLSRKNLQIYCKPLYKDVAVRIHVNLSSIGGDGTCAFRNSKIFLDGFFDDLNFRCFFFILNFRWAFGDLNFRWVMSTLILDGFLTT